MFKYISTNLFVDSHVAQTFHCCSTQFLVFLVAIVLNLAYALLLYYPRPENSHRS